MKQSLFRKESLEKFSSPDQLNDYIRVTSPSVWMMLGTILILLVGILIWGIFGRLDTMMPVCALTDNGQTTCFVRADKIEKINEQMPVLINGQSYRIRSISEEPIRVDETFSEYLRDTGSLGLGEWVFVLVLEDVCGENGAINEGSILIESIAPMRFLLN